MRAMTPAELSRMAGVQTSAMPDECEVLRRTTGAADAYGMPAVTYSVVATAPCGLEHSQIRADASNEAGGRERLGTQVATEVKLLRMPSGTDVRSTDRVRITKRFGQPVTPLTYEVVGVPQAGPSGLLARIQKVTE